jgi:hypothetical protein
MPRPKLIDRPRRIETHIPTSLWNRAEKHLFSELEGRIPHGAVSDLFALLLEEWVTKQEIQA